MDIEKIAIAAVDAALSKTDLLRPSINKDDTKPCWDGEVYIYTDPSAKKDGVKRVPVQVKGKLVKACSETTIKYKVDRSDLSAYLNHGGCMYFVVYIDATTREASQIFYSALLPMRIQSILDTSSSKKKVSVSFFQLPNDISEITGLFSDFYKNSLKQYSFSLFAIPSIDDLIDKGVLKSLTFNMAGVKIGKNGAWLPRITDGKEAYVYANTIYCDTPIPVEYYESVVGITMKRHVSNKVYVSDQLFYDGYDVINSSDGISIIIGDCLTIRGISLDEPSEKVDITAGIKGSLKTRINAIEFLSALFSKGSFRIESTELHISGFENNCKKIAEWQDVFHFYSDISNMLEMLNVKKDLDIEHASDSDYLKLQALVSSVCKGSPVSINNREYDFLSYFDVCNIHLMLICQKVENGVLLFDFFNKKWPAVSETGEYNIPVTQYFPLKADDFISVDNLQIEAVLSDILSVPASEIELEIATNILLEMLRAYDISKNETILEACEKLSHYVDSHKNFIDSDICDINSLQVIARQRRLTFYERTNAARIAAESSMKDIIFGAYVVMEEKEMARTILCEMDEDQVSRIKNYPIFQLYENLG